MSVSSVDLFPKVNAELFRKSAEIRKLRIAALPKLRESSLKDSAALFWVTFDGDSLHAKSVDAASKIGTSPDTFTRLYDKETAKVEAALLRAMLAWFDAKGGAVEAFHGLAVRAHLND